METFLAAAVIFALAFVGMAIGRIRKKHCLGCSCKAAERIMGKEKESHCYRTNPSLD